jgi:calcium binding protein 39
MRRYNMHVWCRACLQDLLTRHKQVVAQFLQDNFTRFFDAFSALLQSNNYVTRRQSLKVRAVR